MKKLFFLVFIYGVGAFTLYWLSFVYAKIEPQNIGHVSCVSYEPKNSILGNVVALDQKQIASVRADLLQLRHYTDCIRIYSSVENTLPLYDIAEEMKFRVIAGVWLDENKLKNNIAVDSAIKYLPRYTNIIAVVVGNETQLLKRISIDELSLYVKAVRDALVFPVGTAEFPFFWTEHKTFAKNVDFIGFHSFAYWEGISSKYALTAIVEDYRSLESLFPDKHILLLETGWPTRGAYRLLAKTSILAQRDFLAQIENTKSDIGNFYNFIEAYDQPWKIKESEGRVGAHWGIFDKNGEDKIVAQNNMHMFVGVINIILYIFFVVVFVKKYLRLKIVAHVMYALFLGLMILVVTTLAQVLVFEYFLFSIVSIFLLIPSQIIITIILSAHFVDIVRIIGEDSELENKVYPTCPTKRFVSIHIPCRNENPDQVICAIKSCLAQSYKNIEIIVIDNNTTDPMLWQPVKDFCANHKQVKFVHIENLSGYKSGALNLALQYTDPNVDTIAVIDSDYVVHPEWLEKVLIFFSDTVKSVQSPQAYKNTGRGYFEKALILEQILFFSIGMKIRNLSNSIIQHGTMCVIDKKALLDIGSWPIHSITEDTYVGIKLLSRGYRAIYIPEVLGEGIAPNAFSEYSKQRFRWVYGAMRILIEHKKMFFSRHSPLTCAQRYYFITGWLYWIAHIFFPIFMGYALVQSYFVLSEERYFAPALLLAPILIYIVLEIVTVSFALKKVARASVLELIITLIAGASLTSTITKAVWVSLFKKTKPFEVTKKNTSLKKVKRQIFTMKYNIALSIIFTIQIYSVFKIYKFRNIDIVMLEITLLIFLFNFLAPIIMFGLSLVSKPNELGEQKMLK